MVVNSEQKRKSDSKVVSSKVRRKIERWALLCYQNCVRLHADSVFLYKKRRYATAYAISVIALEEMGKYQMLAHGLFYDYFDDEDSAKLILNEVYDHKSKQQRFMSQDIYDLYAKDLASMSEDKKRELDQLRTSQEFNLGKWLDYFPSVRRWQKKIDSLDHEKQDSLYVGFPKKGKGIDFTSRIHSPLSFSRKKAERQITMLSDYLVLDAIGVIKGTVSLDFDYLESGMTHGYVKYLQKLWFKMSKSSRKRYNKLIKLEDLAEDN